jgi:hypothetical protein
MLYKQYATQSSIAWCSCAACLLGLRRASAREGTSTHHVGGSTTPSISSGLRCRHCRRCPYNLVGQPWQPSWRRMRPTARVGSCDPPDCVPSLAPGSYNPPGCVSTPSCVHVGGAPPICDPPSSSCGGTPCKKSNMSKLKSSNPPA